STRSRHTIFSRDWSSDVCSSDLPASSGKPLPRVVPAVGTRRFRVALLTGCVGSVLFERTNIATVEVLTRNGCEVVIPPDQGCCEIGRASCRERSYRLVSSRCCTL